MRELMYLSDRKLAQFIPEPSNWLKRLQIKKVTGGLKGGPVNLQVETDDQIISNSRLASVVKHLEMAAKPWENSEILLPGEWVQFDLPFYLWLAESARLDSPVFWLDVSQGVHSPGNSRLLMHGTARHLLGRRFSDSTRSSNTIAHHSDWTNANELISGIQQALLGISGRKLRITKDELSRHDLVLSRLFEAMIDEVEEDASTVSLAAWGAGYARVTASMELQNDKNLVVASPIFVERVPPPTE